MDWVLIASLFWKFSLGLLLLALTALAGYMCATLGSLRNSLNSIRNTLNSAEHIVNHELGELLSDVDKTVKEVNKELPALLQHLNGLTASLQGISETELQPTAHNIREMSAVLNQSLQELESLVQKASQFSGETLEQAEFFRNQLAHSLADIVSLWQGIKAGWENFRASHAQDAPEAEETDG
ncbi:hypothetical protein C6495_10785 [Candidatus Poribacteria bacterium]|nr:MAG: hypothetical protein C6495_10785 [Candidatus Poribacteria bacterium]